MAKKQMTFRIDELDLYVLQLRAKELGIDWNKTEAVEAAIDMLQTMLFWAHESDYMGGVLKTSCKYVMKFSRDPKLMFVGESES